MTLCCDWCPVYILIKNCIQFFVKNNLGKKNATNVSNVTVDIDFYFFFKLKLNEIHSRILYAMLYTAYFGIHVCY